MTLDKGKCLLELVKCQLVSTCGNPCTVIFFSVLPNVPSVYHAHHTVRAHDCVYNMHILHISKLTLRMLNPSARSTCVRNWRMSRRTGLVPAESNTPQPSHGISEQTIRDSQTPDAPRASRSLRKKCNTWRHVAYTKCMHSHTLITCSYYSSLKARRKNASDLEQRAQSTLPAPHANRKSHWILGASDISV